MHTPSLVRRCFAMLLAVIVVTLLVAPGAAQDGAARTPQTLSYGFSANPGTGTFEAAQIFALENGTTTAAPTVDSGCSGPGGQPQAVAVAGWISPPAWQQSSTVMGVGDVTFNIVAAEGGPPQAVATGAVDLTLTITGGEDGTHSIGENTTTIGLADPTTPLGAQLPPSVTFSYNITPAGMHPAGMPIVAILSVSCASTASFALVPTGALTIDYLIGAPTDADTDGDGVPDSVDTDIDGDEFDNEAEILVGSDASDGASTPQTASTVCPDFTFQEVYDSTGNANECPAQGGFPWLILLLVVLGVILVLGLAGGALLVVNRKVRMTVSHDGFQAIEKGQTAEYELTLMATGKKEALVPVELSLKGVPEDWSAVLEPSHLSLTAGEAADSQLAVLRLIPPPMVEYESEAQVTVTATPTDEDGKTSATKPGTSVKTKTIVNIGVTPPEGEGKKKPKKAKAEALEGDALQGAVDDAEAKPKRRLGGLLKRNKGEDAESTTETDAAPMAAAAASAPTGEPKPQIAMGKMVHDPADFSAGDNVTTTVTVRNKGDGPVQGLRLSLYVNDERADQMDVDIDAGASVDVQFHWTARPDENRVRIKGGLKGA